MNTMQLRILVTQCTRDKKVTQHAIIPSITRLNITHITKNIQIVNE